MFAKYRAAKNLELKRKYRNIAKRERRKGTKRLIACVASVPVRAKCYVSRASEDSSRAKIGARAKKGKERGGGEASLPHPRPAPFTFLLSPQFSRAD